MRVISGNLKGMHLQAVPGTTTRPTTDKVKESIFNMIGPYFDGGVVIDLFAGSGSLGIESLSRGMDHAIFIDKDRRAIQTIHTNLKKCRLEEQSEVFTNDAMRAVKALIKRQQKIDLLFLDPPYKLTKMYDLPIGLIEAQLFNENGQIVMESDQSVQLVDILGPFQKVKEQLYGQTKIAIYQQIDIEGDRHE